MINDTAITNQVVPTQIVFIDAQIEDRQLLVDGAASGIETIVLTSDRDGIEQINAALIQNSSLETIHIVAHGAPGCLYLGNSQLSLDIIEQYRQDLGLWSRLSSVVLYGCSVAAGDAGAELIEKLHQLTGANISASSTKVGNKAMGGNWILDKTRSGATTIDRQPIPLFAPLHILEQWQHTLAPTNTGTWNISGSTASTTTAGITTTVEFTPGTGTSFTGLSNGTFNNIAVFSNSAQNNDSLQLVYTWDTTPEPRSTPPQPQAADDTGTGTITITFSQPVTDPIINLDRLGGNSGIDPDINIVGDEESLSNGARWTLTTPGASLAKVSGVDHLDVTPTTIERTPNVNLVYEEGTSESGFDNTRNTAGGSVRVNGTFSTLTFDLTGVGAEGGAADGIELGFILEPEANPTVDLNGAATGENYSTVFSSGGGAVAIADPTAVVTDNLDTIATASISLTNAQTGDLLDTTALPGGTGISVDPSSTATNIILTGVGTPAEYQAAIAAITFNNNDAAPDSSDRTI
ncbi:MAG: DUF4347 domain-containing protein, partial [Cyanobacteria bacterium J06607_15]